MISTGLAIPTADADKLAETTEVPAGVREVLHRRITRLPATAHTILAHASVVGIETDVGVLADIVGAGEHALLDAVEAGLITGLITEPAAGRIRFAHALIRDTLYHDLSRLRRPRIRACAARAIERKHPDDVATLAYHFAMADATGPVVRTAGSRRRRTPASPSR